MKTRRRFLAHSTALMLPCALARGDGPQENRFYRHRGAKTFPRATLPGSDWRSAIPGPESGLRLESTLHRCISINFPKTTSAGRESRGTN